MIRAAALAAATPRHRHLRPAIADGLPPDLPDDPAQAIGFVGDWCADHDVCHDGAVRLISTAFEIDGDDVRFEMVARCRTRAVLRIASETDINAAVADRLAGSPSTAVRHRLAGNRSIPPAVLDRLLVDPDEGVRQSAEWNPILGRVFEMPAYGVDPDPRRDGAAGLDRETIG